MRERALSIILCCILAVSLVGCGSDKKSQSDKPTTNQEQVENNTEQDEKKDIMDSSDDKEKDSTMSQNNLESQEKKAQEAVQMLNIMVNKEFDQQGVENSFSIYDSDDFPKSLAMHLDTDMDTYPEETRNPDKAMMSLTYDLNGEFKEFTTTLGVLGITNGIESVLVNIYVDDEVIFTSGVGSNTSPTDLSFDVSGKHDLKIELSTLYDDYSYVDIVFSNAKLIR